MQIGDIVLTLLPGIGLFFLVGITSAWLEDIAREYAKRELHLDEEIQRLNQANDDVRAIAAEVEKVRDTKAERERTLQQTKSAHDDLLVREVKLTDPKQMCVYEIGKPMPGAVGYYAKAVGPAMTFPYDGRGSASSGVHGRRYARLVIWGQSAEAAQKRAVEFAGPSGQVLTFRPYSGKLKFGEV